MPAAILPKVLAEFKKGARGGEGVSSDTCSSCPLVPALIFAVFNFYIRFRLSYFVKFVWRG